MTDIVDVFVNVREEGFMLERNMGQRHYFASNIPGKRLCSRRGTNEMKRYRIPILYDCDDLPKRNSTDVYEAEVVDKKVKRLEQALDMAMDDRAFLRSCIALGEYLTIGDTEKLKEHSDEIEKLKGE